jgi:hydrogenase-4 component B
MILYASALLLAALSGVPGLFPVRHGARLSAVFMGLAGALGLAAAGWVLGGGAPAVVDLSVLGCPAWGRLRLDAIGAFFLIPVMILMPLASVFGLGYWGSHHESGPRLRLLLGLLAASLAWLAGADHAYTFLLGWEGMALAAFLLVITEDREPAARHAAWIYLIATHTGTLAVFGAFALAAGAWGGLAFAAFPAGFAASSTGTAFFLLLLAGFGMKAGMMPLHFWLPPAHAAAPSHVSAVMSGLLIKMGILGFVRMLSWVPDPPAWWGAALVVLGLLSGVLGVAFALGQHDLKRLLAYHSIENIGIILLGLGLGCVGKATGHPVIQALGFGGALLHTLNHALFKGLLFLAAGSAISATGMRDMEHLGGLGRAMPWTSAAFLAGAWAICGLPPFNGFVSEWLVYLGAFRGLGFPDWMWSAAALSALALIGALALACFAKAFGTVFLGESRRPAHHARRESPLSMLLPMGALAALCLLLGLAPSLIGPALDRAVALVAGDANLPPLAASAPFPWISLLAIILLAASAALWAWATGPWPRTRPTWDCGYAAPSPRMQYSASSFADGLVGGLRWVLWPSIRRKRVKGFFPGSSSYHSHVQDPVLDRSASPALALTAKGLNFFRFLQAGHLPVYLLYVLLTLFVLLAWTVA